MQIWWERFAYVQKYVCMYCKFGIVKIIKQPLQICCKFDPINLRMCKGMSVCIANLVSQDNKTTTAKVMQIWMLNLQQICTFENLLQICLFVPWHGFKINTDFATHLLEMKTTKATQLYSPSTSIFGERDCQRY